MAYIETESKENHQSALAFTLLTSLHDTAGVPLEVRVRSLNLKPPPAASISGTGFARGTRCKY